MQMNLITKTAIVLFIVLAVLFAAASMPGCKWAREVDAAFWESPTSTTTSIDPATGKPTTVVTTETPPLLTLIASTLSLVGFTGLSVWLKRSNSNGKKTATAASDRLENLEQEIAKLFDELVVLKTKAAASNPQVN